MTADVRRLPLRNCPDCQHPAHAGRPCDAAMLDRDDRQYICPCDGPADALCGPRRVSA